MVGLPTSIYIYTYTNVDALDLKFLCNILKTMGFMDFFFLSFQIEGDLK